MKRRDFLHTTALAGLGFFIGCRNDREKKELTKVIQILDRAWSSFLQNNSILSINIEESNKKLHQIVNEVSKSLNEHGIKIPEETEDKITDLESFLFKRGYHFNVTHQMPIYTDVGTQYALAFAIHPIIHNSTQTFEGYYQNQIKLESGRYPKINEIVVGENQIGRSLTTNAETTFLGRAYIEKQRYILFDSRITIKAKELNLSKQDVMSYVRANELGNIFFHYIINTQKDIIIRHSNGEEYSLNQVGEAFSDITSLLYGTTESNFLTFLNDVLTSKTPHYAYTYQLTNKCIPKSLKAIKLDEKRSGEIELDQKHYQVFKTTFTNCVVNELFSTINSIRKQLQK